MPLDPELWDTLETLFLEACRLPLNEQAQFIEASTEGNNELEEELRRMLKGHNKRSVLDAGIRVVLSEALAGEEILPLERIGPYKPLKQLGAGGMGVVYLAAREDWEIQVAVKIPRDIWISPDHLDRFQSEQRVLAQLTHPGIARIYEGGTRANGTPWFAMEYVDGEPITDYCREKDLFAYDRLRLFLAVCEATQYAHSHLIIHRDLKPSNVFVTGAGKVKLLDFGIAKQMGEAAHTSILTKFGLHPVTLAYAAPEQIVKNEVSIKTDIYALGVLLYELLTNKLPFDLAGLHPMQAGETVRDTEPTRPSAVGTRIPGLTHRHWNDLDVLILKAMHKDVGQRYRTVDALTRDIDHFLSDEPLDARPDSTAYRMEKFVRRNRKTLSFSGTGLVLIIGLTVLFWVSLAKARNAALEEVSRTRRVTELTRTMLSGGDADNGPSKDMKVIDILDPALRKAESLKADPIQQAQIYTTIGSAYIGLAEYAKADAVLHSAYQILANRAPVSHEMGEALLELGVLYSAQSNDERSLSCMNKALVVEQQIRPPDRGLLVRARTGVAYALLDSNPKAAVGILNNLIKEPVGDATEEARSDVWNNLATGYINMGEYAKAEPYVRMALAYSRKIRPSIHPDIAAELIDLSMIERERRNYPAAEQDLRKALAIDVAWYPKDHEETADVKRLLANVLVLENRYDDAMPLARKAMMDEQKSLGTANRKTAYAMQIVGELDLKRGNPAEASFLFQQEIASLELLKDSATLPKVFAYLGDAYMAQRRYKQSEHAYRKAVKLYGSAPVPAWDLQAQGNRKLGEALMLQGEFAAAELPLLASYKVWTSSPNSYSVELRLTCEDLVKVYEALQRNAEMERFQRELRVSINVH